ncbi:MAG: nuclear transport factor 2 family protein, partial [Steroidobacteraceae bacterium]
IALQFLSSWSAGDQDGAYALMADDAIWWVAGDLPFSGDHDKQTMYRHNCNLKGYYAEWPKILIDSSIAEEDRVAVEARSVADTPSGIRYRNVYHWHFTLRDGKIIKIKEYMDTKHNHDFKIAMKFSADADRLHAKETFEAEQCGAKGRTV